MKYVVDVNGERIALELRADGVAIGDETLDARLDHVAGTPVLLMTIGAGVHRVIVRRGESRGRYTLWLDGYRYDVEALDERTRAIRDLSGSSGAATGPAPLRAPMPGLIVRVSVQIGDQVEAGQGLVVMEAMKMENELRSSAAGRVKAVHAQAGSAVDKGALLIELE
jgi:acetyl/propionyl-CoA carboxylase alpha subunit